jgi:hypothetical protein
MRELAALVPEQFTKWGIFDMVDPTPTLACGATIGIEDTLALVELLSAAGPTGCVGADRSRTIEVALKVYSDARQERGLWMVRADVLQWRDGQVGKNDKAAFLAAFTVAYEKNTRKIWDVDENAKVDAMVDEVKKEFAKFKARMF